MRRLAIFCLQATTLAIGPLFFSYYHGQTNPPCEEDQAYVVQEDRNPDHGLTWVCVSLDSLK